MESTPTQFVLLLGDWDVPLRFVRDPGEIADMSIGWVRGGFQAW